MELVQNKIASIDELLAALDSTARDVPSYKKAMQALDLDPKDVVKYCQFRDETYCRNLIKRTDDYELILMCWGPGQFTPVHDHAGQEGLVYMIEGKIEEILYSYFKYDQGDMVELQEFEKTSFEAGGNSQINDGIGLHKLGNPTSERAISLHLYSYPINTCRIYDEAGKTFVEKTLLYYTNDGALV